MVIAEEYQRVFDVMDVPFQIPTVKDEVKQNGNN